MGETLTNKPKDKLMIIREVKRWRRQTVCFQKKDEDEDEEGEDSPVLGIV